MGILGIENRTENWKTVEHFHNLKDDAKLRIARKLGEHEGTSARDISIELFWFGMRDWMEQNGGKNKSNSHDFAERYARLFPDLRDRVNKFTKGQDKLIYKFKRPKEHNYTVSNGIRVNKRNEKTISAPEELCSNLVHTEIDIVLQTPNHLFIGEAKGESPFGAKSEYVLVHQLIREYVMANILVDLTSSDKQVIPFVVGNSGKLASLKNTAQVKFMLSQCQPDGKPWLKEENVLSWNDI